MGGNAVECAMDADCTVMDLLDACDREDNQPLALDKAHAAQVEAVLLTENGLMMQKHVKLADYHLTSGSIVMMVMKARHIGCYCCWLALENDTPHCIDLVKFSLVINEDSVCMNGVAGHIDRKVGSGENEESFTVKLFAPVVIKSERPYSKASFQTTDFEFTWSSGDYSKSWWFPINGKVTGRSS